MSRHRFALLAPVLGLFLFGGPATAVERRPVPEFPLLGWNGDSASVRSVVADRTVVLIYVMPHAASSERLLKEMMAWAPPIDPQRIVLIVDAQSGDAARWLSGLLPAEGPTPRVLFDADGSGRAALRVSGAPTLMGVEGGEIRWDLAGVLNDPSALEPVLRNWTTRAHTGGGR